MTEVCYETDFVNCKFGEDGKVCRTHDNQGAAVQTTPSQPYIPISVRRAKRYSHHAQKRLRQGRSPKTERCIFKTLVDIKGPSYYTGRLLVYHVGMKRFVRVSVESQTQTLYSTIIGVAKPGSGIEIKDRVL